MRGTLIFAGSSCPDITDKICHNLGMARADAELTQFSNGETSVRILTSVREKDVFVVQSGSPRINDTIMELLIMISACRGGSANKITGTSLPCRRSRVGHARRLIDSAPSSCAALLPLQPPVQEEVS
jgi:phosphoribosylpyrophosphate synthetase